MPAGFVMVCGSRSLSVSPSFIAYQVHQVCPSGWLLLHGGARGVDSSVPFAASLLGWDHVAFLPNYQLLGRRAPLVRNLEMLALCSHVIALWDGRSSGTSHVIAHAIQLGRPLHAIDMSLLE